ncbi:MAG: IPTL-CTERM sorting domain-containing protein [Bacteroidota bacterium]
MQLHRFLKVVSISFFLCLNTVVLIGQNTFTNGVGNSDWHTAGNWSGGVPTATDIVVIPNGLTANISMDAVARTIRLAGGTLNMTAGTLTIDEGDVGLDGIFFDGGGILSVSAGAVVIIRNTFFAGIFVDNSSGNTATINNSGTITIGPSIGLVGIDVNNNNNSLKITNSGTIGISSTFDDGIVVRNNSSVALLNNGTFTIGTNIGRDGIRVRGGDLQITNTKTLTFGPDLPNGDGIYVINGGSINLTNQAGGLLTTSANPNIGFSFITVENNPDVASLISNFGQVTVNMDNTGDDFLNLFGGNVSVVNQAGGVMTVSNISDDAFNFDGNTAQGGAILSNFGTINVTNVMDEAFDISTPGSATNQAAGVIMVNGVVNEDAFNVTGTFTNDGRISIAGVQTQAGIDVEVTGPNSGSFINNNLINITMGNTSNPAIEVDALASLTNTTCAIINILTQSPIVNNGIFTNDGVLTSFFTGTNTNSGTFNNAGRLSTPTGAFLLSPNGLTGSNTIITSSPIPATVCLPPVDPDPIPTLSQWGLLIFGLLLLNLGVFFILRMEGV